MTDIEHLVNMAKITLNQANEALERGQWTAYGTYVKEYNNLLGLARTQCGEEICEHLEPIPTPSRSYVDGIQMSEYLSTAVLKLRELVAYLEVEKQR
jgi:hypothetical protein